MSRRFDGSKHSVNLLELYFALIASTWLFTGVGNSSQLFRLHAFTATPVLASLSLLLIQEAGLRFSC